jgi:AAA domain
MPANDLRKVRMSDVPNLSTEIANNWLWHGYLLPGDITLLTSQWKTGKTTLLAGLLRQLDQGESFVNRPLRPAKALVVSEESHAQWADRLRKMPIGPNVQLLARPFRGRPSVEEWNALIDDARDMRLQGELDLFVVDPLAPFLPGRCESDAGTLLEMLQPLHRLATEGVAILLMHHPRKKPSEPGSAARGSGALLGFVDIVLELNRYGKLKSDARRRQIVALSRKPETPERLAFEWDPQTCQFTELGDPRARQFEENWQQVLLILQKRKKAATHHELLMDWPDEQGKPSASALYDWLNRAHADNRVRRQGAGTRDDPWRYRLTNEDDAYYDRGKLPPMRGLLDR